MDRKKNTKVSIYMPTAAPPFRVAFYVDGYWGGEATSRALRHKVEALSGRETAKRFDYRIFCAGTNMANPRIRVLRNFHDLVTDAFFEAADLHVFEFGWHYDIFDAILFCPEQSRTAAFYHGITPIELCADQDKARRSHMQKRNLLTADRVFCASPYTLSDLARFGVAPDRLRLLPLPVSLTPRGAVSKASDGPIELLHVGRLTPHKGAFDLVRAMAGLAPGLAVKLRIVGGRDEKVAPGYHESLKQFIAANDLGDVVELVGGVGNDADLSALYARAEAVILPSYHDGYCLPVIEAFAHGCHVIAYDGANLPNIANGLGMLVPQGDIGALGAAIAAFVAAVAEARRGGTTPVIATSSGPVALDRHRLALAAYTQRFDRRLFEGSFLGQVEDLLIRPPAPAGGRIARPDFPRL
ncbi:MAG TPA: glycosyltransferase [Parvibaculum sp.]